MGVAYERGLVLYRQHRYQQAADEFRRELSAAVGSADAHAMLGMSLLNAGDRSGAEAAMREAVRLGPGLPYPHYALACLTVRVPAPAGHGWFGWTPSGRLAAARRRWVAARHHVSTAIAIDPRNADFFALQAAIEYDLRQWESAVRAAGQGLAVNPAHVRCQTLLGRALAQSGRTAEAGQAFRQALERDPESALAHMAQGGHLLRAGRFRRAREHFRQSLRLDPSQSGAEVAMRHVRWLWFPPYALLMWCRARAAGHRRLSQAFAFGGVACASLASGAGPAAALVPAVIVAVLVVAFVVRTGNDRRSGPHR